MLWKMAFTFSFFWFTGMSYTMIGRDGCTQSLGVIPCAISWLFKLINRKKDKTWANITVSVSAVEVCGENNAIRDLLSDVETGNCKETYKPDAFLKEDPVCGIQASVECTSFVLIPPLSFYFTFSLFVQRFSQCILFQSSFAKNSALQPEGTIAWKNSL